MKAQRMSVLIFLLASLVVLPTFAATAPANHASAPAAKPAEHSMRAEGVISSVDATAKSLVVKEGSKTLTFNIGSATLTAKGKPVTIAELKAGEKVEVHYTGSGASLTASSVVVRG